MNWAAENGHLSIVKYLHINRIQKIQQHHLKYSGVAGIVIRYNIRRCLKIYHWKQCMINMYLKYKMLNELSLMPPLNACGFPGGSKYRKCFERWNKR